MGTKFVRVFCVFFLVFLAVLLALGSASVQVDPAVFAGLRWRLLGPFRAGRTVAVAGVPGRPNEFYFGGVAGGVWKTANAGETWTPVFDAMPIASIGAIAVAPSDVKVVYVGSGEADMRSDISYGDGMYKSTDAGKSWTHIGLRDSQQIGRVLVDPHDANLIYVAALGHAYGANAERGVFRSRDGGQSWQKVLYKDEDTGAIDLAFDPRDSRIIYAAMWRTRRPPWNVYPPSNAPGSGLYKSTDSGDTWQQITGHGFPSEGLGRIGVAVAPADAKRVYAIVDAKDGGLYRSDDAGATWRRMSNERRIWQRGWYFGGVTVDPKNPDIVYVLNTSTYRSRDGGQTMVAIKGAPGGDDYHQLWIYPDDPDRMVLASDQGAIVSVDGAENWSSWYNQATAQFYHVAADNRFPFWVYGAQQDSGAAGTPIRSDFGNIAFRDWRTLCAGGEAGSIAPDPLHAGVVYGGTVERCDVLNNESQNVAPTLNQPGPFRSTWTLPLIFSEADAHALYFSHQMLFKTTDGGQNWTAVSPDLTRENPGAPANLDQVTATYAPGGPRRGVIYTIAPSPVRADDIWIGTDDGVIQVTHDGGKDWQNVTPPELTPWSKVGTLDASHFDAATVYAAIDRHRLDDFKPYIYATHDAGKSWKLVTTGLPAWGHVNVVKEDPVRKGLLYAGTEIGVFVSFDDGAHWQALQMNLPATSIRDFAIRDNTLVVATHGRSFWALDDLTPLRQEDAKVTEAAAYLFRPPEAVRLRPGNNYGTPLPLGTPAAQNPPDGAVIDYWLKTAPGTPVVLEILDATGQLVRRYSSEDKAAAPNPRAVDIPEAWLGIPRVLSAAAGMHQWFWDFRYAPPAGVPTGRYGEAGGPWALPGNYMVKLTAAGQSYTQPLVLKMDPRVQVSMADLRNQFALARQVAASQAQVAAAQQEARRLRDRLRAARAHATAEAASALDDLDRKIVTIAGAPPPANPEFFGAPEEAQDRSTLLYLGRKLAEIAGAVNSADAAPTGTAAAAYQQAQQGITAALARWTALKQTDLAQANAVLRRSGLQTVEP